MRHAKRQILAGTLQRLDTPPRGGPPWAWMGLAYLCGLATAWALR